MEIIVDHQEDLMDHLDGHMMESPSPGNMELSDGNSDVCENDKGDEALLFIDEFVQKFADLPSLSTSAADDDDEEGAIKVSFLIMKEDFVPFRRVSHDNLPSQSLHILNLPPEMDLSLIINLFLEYSQLFKKASSFETNKIQVICHSVDIAKTVKEKLDGFMLLNRELQVVFSPKPDLANQAYTSNNMVSPSFPVPPAPELYRGRGSSTSRFNSYQSYMDMVPPPPPRAPTSQFYRGKDRSFGDSKLSGIFNFENHTPSQWFPNQSILDRHIEFSTLYKKHGIIQRYLLLKDFNVAMAVPNLETWIKETCGYPYPQVHAFFDSDYVYGRLLDLDQVSNGLPDIITLHLCFASRKQSIDIYKGLMDLNLGICVEYTAPYLALNCLWIGNLSDILRQNYDISQVKQALSAYGNITHFKSLLDNNCIFVTYQDVQSAIKARNHLLGASLFFPNQNVFINVDFSASLNNPNKNGDSSFNQGDLEQRLISALKSTPKGEKLLEEFLSGSSKYSSMNELLTSHFNNHNNDDYRQYNNNKFRRDRYEEPKRYSVERRSDGDGSRYAPSRSDRYSRSARDSYDSRSLYRKRPVYDSEYNAKKPKLNTILCQLLKRGKEICKVSAVFSSGDSNLQIPRTLDVNQRAHPERLSALLEKSTTYSLWQLGADTRQDSIQYDKLCDYLISKNRVALLQYENLQIYIVPPYDKYIEMLRIPDAKFLYCYVIPNETSTGVEE